MIGKNMNGQPSILSNEKIEIELGYDSGIYIKRWRHKSLSDNEDVGMVGRELFILEVEEQRNFSSQFEILNISEVSDKTQEMISVMLCKKDMGFTFRVCLISNQDNTINLIFQLAAEWVDNCPKEVYMHMPFFANFRLSNEKLPHYFFPANPCSKSDGSSIIKLHNDFPMPLGIFNKCSGKGFSIQFPTLSEDWFIWAQNRNVDLHKIKSEDELKHHNILLRPGYILADVFELKFTAIDDGWNEFFFRWREDARQRFGFGQYERKDLSWVREMFCFHFTFIYGCEAYNYEKSEVNIEGLIDQGKELGGYDAVLLWHQYPRLGVDKRNQWDFFDDFPGGKEGLRYIVEKAHELGVKVFLPFKPWDVGSKETLEDTTKSISRLIKDTDIDGIFFDTMNSIPKSFRESIDQIKPGVAFCTELHPCSPNNIEMVTGSWDQYWDTESMPEVDLLRYVLPEHVSPIISRWHVGMKKDMLIKRAIFNGTGIVIWQDVFGSWLPYSREQKEKILKWKKIWKENKDIYCGSKPVPLYPTLQEGLYCNYFPSDDGKKVIYSIYNDTDKSVSGALVNNNHTSPANTCECWTGADIILSKNGNHSIIESSIKSKDIIIIKMII